MVQKQLKSAPRKNAPGDVPLSCSLAHLLDGPAESTLFCGLFWDLLTVNFRKLSSVQMLRVGRRKCLLCKLVFLQFSSQTVGCRQYMEPRLLTNAVHPTTPSTTNTPKLYTAEQLRHFIFQQKWVNVVKVIKYQQIRFGQYEWKFAEFMVFEDF